MVIKYDDVQPHLDSITVTDKRAQSQTVSKSEKDEPSQADDNSTNNSSPSHSLNEREKIYQRGTDGLKEIKKARLENWLGTSEGVGNQTEQRVLMVFQRNESVHRNPHVLYNLLDDELNASASYLNTMVQDIFAPEEEHGDLLQSQGYTPWYSRGAGQASSQMGGPVGGPMNATGRSGFSPNSGFGSGGNEQSQQQQQPSGGQSEPSPEMDPGDETLTRDDAELMMRQAMAQADSQQERNALLSGLSDATDEALKEMATNVGGLAGTIQKVVDEALVGYARENPQWVIENMDILQKVLGATEDMPGGDSGGGSSEPEQHQKVDSALESITGGNNSSPEPTVAESTTSSPEPQQAERNPDLNEEHMAQSDFNPMSSGPEDSVAEDNQRPEPKPTPGDNEAKKAEEKRKQFESETDDGTSEDDSFDEIFGDLQ